MNDLDKLISDALRAQAEQVTEADLSPAEAPAAPARRRLRCANVAPALAAAAIVGIAITTAVVVSEPTASTSQRTGGTDNRPIATPSSLRFSSNPLGGPLTPVSRSTSRGRIREQRTFFLDAGSDISVPAGYPWYVPIWPFANYGQVTQWVHDARISGASPWHLDAAATAQFFVQNFLGFHDLGVVTSTEIAQDEAHIGIGFRDPNGVSHTAAVIHLVRYTKYADDKTAPWEVVGTDDTSFSLETPKYGTQVNSPLTAGGHITGTDENIRLWVRTLDKIAGTYCCVAAGGKNGSWSAKISWGAKTGTPLTIVAVTGGHLQEHERFAIQGVWARAYVTLR